MLLYDIILLVLIMMEKQNYFDELKDQYSYKNVNKLVCDLVLELRQYNPLNVLYDIYKYYSDKIMNLSKAEREEFSSIITYVQSIYAANNCSNNYKLYDTEKLIKRIKEVITGIMLSCDFEIGLDSPDNFSSHLYEISFGKAYPVLVPTMINGLLNSQEELLKVVYNVTCEDIVNGLLRIAEAFAKILQLSIDKKEISLKEFNVKNVTNWPDDLITDLSWEIGECCTYSIKDRYANWFNVEMPCKQKPFIKINKDSYFFDLSIVNDSFYRALQKTIISKNSHYKDLWQINQKISSENFSIDLLSSIFKDATIYKDNYYKDINGKKVENDGLILVNNLLFVIEVKAGSYTPRSIFTDPNSHNKAKNNLIENPLSQCERFIQTLNANNNLDIFDNQYKNKIVSINKDNYDYVIPISITLDPLGEIHVMHKNNHVENYISISMADLLIYSIFFDNEPILFIYYILKRIEGIKIKEFLINDELDYLGSYLCNRHFPDAYNNLIKNNGLEDRNVGTVMVDNMHENIDNYFMSFMQVQKPKFDITNFIYDLIKKIGTKLDRDSILCAINILNQDDDYFDALEKNIDIIIDKQKETKRFRTITLLNENSEYIPIQLFANDINNICVTDDKALLYTLAIMDVGHYSSLFCIIINKNGNTIENIEIKYLKNSDIDKFNSDELEILKMDVKSRYNIGSDKKMNKIGRNDPCPCGSGKKYKKCCLIKEISNKNY